MSDRRFWLTVAVLLLLGLLINQRGDKRPEPVQAEWTQLEQDCAIFVRSTEHGDQYGDRQLLRMCRVYIEINGGFGGRE